VLAALQAHGVTPPSLQEADDSEALVALVACGAGLGLFLEGAAAQVPGRWALVTPVSDLGTSVEAVVLWRAEDERAPGIRPFLRIAGEVRATSRQVVY
jgi:DNA-binding transcriptional LysR family regulator